MAVDKDAQASLPPLVYGVWIPGLGWLKSPDGRHFADLNREAAESACRLYGPGARVEVFDDAMRDLEPVFLEQERRRAEGAERRGWWSRLLGS